MKEMVKKCSTDQRFILNTSYLTDSYITFTLKMESVSKNTIFGLKMMLKSGLEKIILNSIHAGRWLFLCMGSVHQSIFIQPNRISQKPQPVHDLMDRQLWNGFIMTQKEKFLKIFLLFFLCAYIICQVAQTRLVDRAHLQVTRNKYLPHPHVRLMELLWQSVQGCGGSR